ncbi:ROK family protein [Saccharopolyspora sp. CA-218241]|uniref:ROK family protein n=1 Tax=Saccharopolyspora sp. CA-218241 TaxID=3240027 RepID=UPI003D995AFC
MGTRVRNRDQAELLRLLRDRGPLSRAELTDGLALSKSKVAVELERLGGTGLVEDAGRAASRGGRPSSLVRVGSDLRFAGIDIGATSVDVAVTDGALRVLRKVQRGVDVRSGPEEVLGTATALLRELCRSTGTSALAGIGAGVPGPVSFADGVAVVPPIMPGWDKYPVRERLSTEFDCPALLDNDVNLMAAGEFHAGAARGVGTFLFVKLGTGVGAGIVVDGRVHRGVDGSAGDIGHIQVHDQGPVCACGNVGCLEAFFSGVALRRDATTAAEAGRSPFLAERLTTTSVLTGRDVADAAAAGDPVATGLIREGGRHVGEVVAKLVSFFNPARIVIGGGLANLGDLLLAEVRSTVYHRSLPLATRNLPVVLTGLGDAAGVLGAVRMISDDVFSPNPVVG